MFGPEFLILLALVLILVLPVALKEVSKRRDRETGRALRSAPAHVPAPTRPTIPGPADLPGVREAIARGEWDAAVELYRRASGLPRARAEAAVMAAAEPGPNQLGRRAVERRDLRRDQEGWPELPSRNQG